MNEYIIINKTAIENRIKELEKEIQEHIKKAAQTGDYDYQFEDRLDEVNQILSQSTPLIPEIEKSWEDGRDVTKVVGSFPFIETHYINKTSQDYISNLKLDI